MGLEVGVHSDMVWVDAMGWGEADLVDGCGIVGGKFRSGDGFWKLMVVWK